MRSFEANEGCLLERTGLLYSCPRGLVSLAMALYHGLLFGLVECFHASIDRWLTLQWCNATTAASCGRLRGANDAPHYIRSEKTSSVLKKRLAWLYPYSRIIIKAKHELDFWHFLVLLCFFVILRYSLFYFVFIDCYLVFTSCSLFNIWVSLKWSFLCRNVVKKLRTRSLCSALSCPHIEMKLKQNSLKTVLKFLFFFL